MSYGIVTICLITYTTINTIVTIVGATNGSILPLIIFYVTKSIFSYSLFTFEPKALCSSTLFFLLKALLRESMVAFFLFFNVIYISSSIFNLDQWFLWTILLMHNQILKDFCQYQGILTSIFLIPLIFLNIFIPPI